MKKLSVLEKIILLLIVAVTLFIWSQSAIPKTKSQNESIWVTQKIVQPSVDAVSDNEKTVNVMDIRKVAHLLEYSALGLLTALFVKNIKKWYFALIGCFAVAFIDESIQVLSQRGPEIQDVWIDTFGAAVGIIVGFMVVYALRFLKHRAAK